jgi:uncharacterized protein DUF3152
MSQPLVLVAALLVVSLGQPAGALEHAVTSAGDLPAIKPTREGFVFVDADGARVGRGRLRTYRLEVEPHTGIDPRAFSDLAEGILNDKRGWIGAGNWSLQRVSRYDPDIRIVLATPATVDKLCARAGLQTGGEVSCWNGRFAALNVKRWKRGAAGFNGSLRTYRRYLLNHEVGHGLGYAHKSCPRRGAWAPVMQQQTFATAPCRANGWPARSP